MENYVTVILPNLVADREYPDRLSAGSPSVDARELDPVVEGLGRCAVVDGWPVVAALAAARRCDAWRVEAERLAARVVDEAGDHAGLARRFAERILTG